MGANLLFCPDGRRMAQNKEKNSSHTRSDFKAVTSTQRLKPWHLHNPVQTLEKTDLEHDFLLETTARTQTCTVVLIGN